MYSKLILRCHVLKLETENCFLFFGNGETGSLTDVVIMNVQASKTHQEGIYINRVSYILGSQFALSQPPRTYRKKNCSFVSSSQVLTLHSYFLLNISLFNSYTVVSFFNLHCLPTEFYGGFIGFLWNMFIFPVFFISLF